MAETALQRLDTIAKEHVLCGEVSSFHQGYAKAIADNPDLYRQARKDPASRAVASGPPVKKVASRPTNAALTDLLCIAAEYRTDDPRLSEAQSFVKALSEHPETYLEARRAEKGGI